MESANRAPSMKSLNLLRG